MGCGVFTAAFQLAQPPAAILKIRNRVLPLIPLPIIPLPSSGWAKE
jgi:hypothetical protein